MHYLSSFIFLLVSFACRTDKFPFANQNQTYHFNREEEGCVGGVDAPSIQALLHLVTIPPTDEPGERLLIRGTVYQADGKTPAPDVVLYMYHTNAKGRYPKNGSETGYGKRQGYLRGWLKTDKQGVYQITTVKPAAYPGGSEPAHIHLTITPPGRREYCYTFLFAGDPLLTPAYQQGMLDPVNVGILPLKPASGNTFSTVHNIILNSKKP